MSILSLLLVVLIVVLHAVCTVIAKRIAHRGAITGQMRILFAACAVISLVVAAPQGMPAFSLLSALIFLLGMGNAAAAVAQFRAYRESLALASLFLAVPDLVAILLAVCLLGELHYLSAPLVAGIALMAAAVLVIRFDPAALTQTVSRTFWRSVALFCLVWGFVGFFDKFSAMSGVPGAAYLLLWYSGALSGSLIVHAASREPGRDAPLAHVHARDAILYAAFAWVLRLSVYLLYALNPIVVAAPLCQAVNAFVPLGLAVLLYHEHARLSRQKRWAIGAAACGAALIVFGAQR